MHIHRNRAFESSLLHPPQSYENNSYFLTYPPGIPGTNHHLVNSGVNINVEAYLSDLLDSKRQSADFQNDSEEELHSNLTKEEKDEEKQEDSSEEVSAFIAQMKAHSQFKKKVPYHLLSTESKLAMLEYLLDELLETDLIYNNEEGATKCKECPLGKFQKDSNQTQCDDCSVGTYADKLGLFECIPCPYLSRWMNL